MKHSLLKWTSFLAVLFLSASFLQAQPRKYPANYKSPTTPEGLIVVAYVSAGSEVMPDPFVMTHINYAFGHVNETFNGVNISNPDRLKKLVTLKQQNPNLKIQLSIGGWGSGRFSEMAADPKLRKAFAKDCGRIVKEFGIDGIDIDWEYPTNGGAGISESAADTYNYTLLMKDIRKAIGKKALLTLASSSSARYIDFPSILPYISFVNVMSYDMGTPPMGWHNALYPSEQSRRNSCQQTIDRHIKVGIPITMITMGLPFYGRGARGYQDYMDWKVYVDWKKTGKLASDGLTEGWDDVAKVPYLNGKDGRPAYTFENEKSLKLKCDYIKERKLLGGMYWEYTCDDEQGTLRNLVRDELLK
ncbi:MAG: glycoside hydrolase [Bacteroidaceae bacterium]|nr:glycoside hydrolase [Bacteroidaceae bacterium]